jgi:hypothetical protein
MAERKKRKATANRQSGRVGVVNLPGGRKAEIIREGDPNGRLVAHPRTIDTLGRMRKAGTITPPMYDAARDFQAQFTIAALDSMATMSLVRVSGGSRRADFTDRQVAARENVHRAMDVLGGINSPAGSCVWHVVGLEYSISQWAMRQGWGGRLVRRESARGILIAGLGILSAHHGYQQPHQKLWS